MPDIAEVQELQDAGKLESFLRPLESALEGKQKVEVDPEFASKIMNGQVLPLHDALTFTEEIVFTSNDKAIAVYAAHPEKDGLMKPLKMFPLNSRKEENHHESH